MKTEPVSAKMTVTLVVDGKTIELSEADARKVLSELRRLFPDPPSPMDNWKECRGIPQWPIHPPINLPYTQNPEPIWSPKITCSTSSIRE